LTRHLAGSTFLYASILERGKAVKGSKWFSSTQIVRRDDSAEQEKRLPSDDPSQLPSHFFTPEGPFPKPGKIGMFKRFRLSMAVNSLTDMSNGEFEREDFLKGCTGAFEEIMETFTGNSTEGLEYVMEARVLEAFQHCLDEYSKHGIVCSYESGAVKEADIVAINFHETKDGRNRVSVDVQFVNEQRITLRDETGRAVGPVGEWVVRPSVWRFSTTLPELRWMLSDMP